MEWGKSGTLVAPVSPITRILSILVPQDTIFQINQGVNDVGYIEQLTVKTQLGTGRYGPTWQVVDSINQRYFALEKINLKDYSKPALDQFFSEAQLEIDNLVKSDCILQTYGVLDMGQLKLAMLHEYVDGVLLSDWITINNNAPWETKSQLFSQILLGTTYALQLDKPEALLVPENILVTNLGQPKLLFLGLARYQKTRYFNDSYESRFTHAAPEYLFKVRDKAPDSERNIVFILSCLLYALVTGKPYWHKELANRPDFNSMFHDGALKPDNIIETFHPDFNHSSEAIMTTLRKGTVFDPEKRTLTIAEIVNFFEVEETYAKPRKVSKPKRSKPIFKTESQDVVEQKPQSQTEKKDKEDAIKSTGSLKLVFGVVAVIALIYFFLPERGIAPVPTEEKLAWNKALEKNTEYYYKQFATEFPGSTYIDAAQSAISELDENQINLNQLTSRRYTGKVTRFGDAQILSVRFRNMENKTDQVDFICSVNLGPIRKDLLGTVEKGKFTINFIEDNQGTKFNLQPGRIYDRDGKLMIESTELEQYWILE
ncbi:MAG: hypothetical protein AAF502_12390 [Bacteroidota bacterium]